MEIKNKTEAGADEFTPSIPQFFSWINNTNEGSTEKQTLINLEFFAWLKKEYGMQLKIYAWDAGNFDGASDGFGNLNSAKFQSQFPNGYSPIVRKAKDIGVRMGLWGSPDGFGNTPEEEKTRFEFFVHLCKDYHFAQFKIDGVCGQLRKEKAGIYEKMLKECRKYSPDLIVNNHRLILHGAEKYTTTFLWKGIETYVDVASANSTTGMHNRCFIFDRGYPDNLQRLCEDHGTCISSSPEYFEDDLIYQSFGRCMILAPEIYGNPWFLKDDEYPILARIYNLHKRVSDILVNGLLLSDSYGNSPISRGNDKHRFIVTGNNSWNVKSIKMVPSDCGIRTDEKLFIVQRFPTEKFIACVSATESVSVNLKPFRAHLFEIATKDTVLDYLKNKEYLVLHEDENGKIIDVKEVKETPDPIFLAQMSEIYIDDIEKEKLFEAENFAISNDSLESRAVKRSGDTEIKEVYNARKAFFEQERYYLRGTEGKFAFDKNPNTFFDALSRTYQGGQRVNGGCLRVDFGVIFDCDTVEIDCFAVDNPIYEIAYVNIPSNGNFSTKLDKWEKSGNVNILIKNNDYTIKYVVENINTIEKAKGKILTVSYPVGKLRYFRLPKPMDRIFDIRLIKNGKEIVVKNPHVNNMQSDYLYNQVKKVLACEFVIPKDEKEWNCIAVALEGIHGVEGAYCVAEIAGELRAFTERAPTFRANQWEHRVMGVNKNNTYFLTLNQTDIGKKIKIFTLLCNENCLNVVPNVYLCCKKV